MKQTKAQLELALQAKDREIAQLQADAKFRAQGNNVQSSNSKPALYEVCLNGRPKYWYSDISKALFVAKSINERTGWPTSVRPHRA